MKLVNDAMLKRMRSFGEQGMQTKFTHLVRTVDENPYGDSDEAWADAGDHMGWMRQENDPAIVAQYGLAAATGIFRLHLPHTVEVAEGDMFVEWKADGSTPEPDLYLVQNVNTENTYRMFTTCTLRKRK